MAYIIPFCCVLGLSIGQILFKISANALLTAKSLFALQVAVPLFAAICLYGITSVAWVWALQKIELGRIYPLMALAFVFVPLGSHFIFDERFHIQYFFGIALIMIGIIITVKA